MGAALTCLGATVVLLALLAGLGRRTRGFVGVLVIAQALYFAVAFVLRPLVLVLVQPVPRKGDVLADPRLAALGYSEAVPAVFALVLTGLGLLAGAYWCVSRVLPRRRGDADRPALRLEDAELVVLLGAGWASRLAYLLVGGSVLTTFSALASLACGAALLRDLPGSTARHRRLWVLVPLVSEVAWSVLVASKAPVFAALLWLLVSRAARGRISAKVVVPMLVGALVSFSVVQSVKTERGMLLRDAAAAAGYPSWSHPLLPVVHRFDLFSAATDAHLAGPGRWLTPAEVLDRLWRSLVPSQLLDEKPEQAGARWAVEVRGQSLEHSDTGVHLAEGPIAEGYVLAGTRGVVLEVLFLVVLTTLVGLSLSSRRAPFVFFAVLMTSQPYLFERGVLGMTEAVGKNLQVTVAAVGVLAVGRTLLRAAHRHPGPTRPTRTALPGPA